MAINFKYGFKLLFLIQLVMILVHLESYNWGKLTGPNFFFYIIVFFSYFMLIAYFNTLNALGISEIIFY